MKQALTIAGSDSGGGAGIQADIKTMQANGVFAASVITAVTAQNTVEVRGAVELPLDFIRLQLTTVFDDLDISAAKTGMLSSAGVIETVAGYLSDVNVSNLVVDPVMISKSGFKLLADDAVAVLRDRLLPLALVATPNLHEAALLAGFDIEDVSGMKRWSSKVGTHHLRAAQMSCSTGRRFGSSRPGRFLQEACTEPAARFPRPLRHDLHWGKGSRKR
jgi:hydroxymethylpyrimidine/phosphomethylpyrimidine kinase